MKDEYGSPRSLPNVYAHSQGFVHSNLLCDKVIARSSRSKHAWFSMVCA